MPKAIVVGSGAGGCMAAKELASCGLDVAVLEAGRTFRPFAWNMDKLEPVRRAGLFFDERMIRLLFPEMRIDKAQDGLVHVVGRAVGGTTTLATGNALRYDRYLVDIGINLDAEFAELENEVPQTTEHRARWSKLTERLFSAFEDLGLDPQVTPKFMADASIGSYDGKHLDKPLVDSDWETIARAVDLSYDVLQAVGVAREQTFFGTLNAGHPGGSFPLTEAEADTLHHDVLPANLYLADASLLPRSMGNPPILTIMALAKRAARLAAQHVGA